MGDMWLRIVENLAQRISGSMNFRLVLQPIMASIFAILAGIKDAKAGRPPYVWALVTDSVHRIELIKDGFKGVGKVFILALALDVAYQIIEMRFVYPGEALIVGFVLRGDSGSTPESCTFSMVCTASAVQCSRPGEFSGPTSCPCSSVIT
jgi:hypothetical protein